MANPNHTPENKTTMFTERYRLKLKLQKQSGLYRSPLPIEHREGKFIYSKGARLINFASNDYLGLGSSRTLCRKVADNFNRYGSSSSSSRLVAGNYSLIGEAEKAFAEYFEFEAALFFPSGYQANLGMLATLFEPGDTVIFDKHIHASSVKGLSMSGATTLGFNHSAFTHLEKRLVRQNRQVGVVTESLFSMDGDCPDMARLNALKKQYGFLCVVDEAHAYGALGRGGRGLATDVADVAVGTFGKALGLFGAFAFMPEAYKAYLLNFSSPQIYTTTLPPAHAASALDVLTHLAGAGKARRHLADISRQFKTSLVAAGFNVQGDAHILAVQMGDERRAVTVAKKLLAKGFFVLPARYPTVPLQAAILRISLTTQHTWEDVARFIDALKEAHESQ